jgi:hypothetical protein
MGRRAGGAAMPVCHPYAAIAATAVLFVLAMTRVQVESTTTAPAPNPRPAYAIDWSPLLPEAPGRDYVLALCSSCHTPGVLVLQRRGPGMWRDFLLRMNAARAMGGEICSCIGGPLDETEIQVIASYLAGAFGRSNPIDQLPLNVNTAAEAALARLPGLAERDVRALVQRRARAPFTTKEDVARLLGAATFKAIADFIDVKDSIFRREGLVPM